MSGMALLQWIRKAVKPGTVFAAVVLAWMAVEVWCVSDATTSSDENRTLETFPRATRAFERDYDFGARFERWFADHFRRRKSMMRLSNRLRLRGNHRVIHGKDGWIYASTMGCPKMFTHANRFDAEQLETARRRMAEFGRAAKAAGVKRVYFTFSNDKESICPEFYPDGREKVHPESRFDQLWNALQGVTDDVTTLRFTEQLLAAKKDTKVFCRSGTHMNDLASYLVYGWLSDAIAADFPSYEKVRPAACRFGRDRRHTDDDLLKLGAIPFYPEACLENDFAELKAPTSERTLSERRPDGIPRSVLRFRNAHVENGLRLFLITDSFGRRWVPYLAESVSEMESVQFGKDHPFEMGQPDSRELLEMKPDILIVNFTERFLQRLLTLEFPKEVR